MPGIASSLPIMIRMIDSGLRDLAAKLAMVRVRMLSLTLPTQTTLVAQRVVANSNMLWLWDNQASVAFQDEVS